MPDFRLICNRDGGIKGYRDNPCRFILWKGGGSVNFGIIEDIRKQKRVTVTELCEAAGIDRATYYRLQKNPDAMKFSTWHRIVDFLGMTKAEKQKTLQ